MGGEIIMRALTGELLLKAWDLGAHRHPVHQGCAMLALAMSGASHEQIADLSLSEANLLLLQLHEISFGPLIEAFATCSNCGAQLEVRIRVADLIRHHQAAIEHDAEEWIENGRLFRLRAMTGSDLLASLDAATSAEAEQSIVKRCLQVLPQEIEADPDDTPASLMERFERVNQAAELSCTVECAACSRSDTLELNPAQFLFRLVERGAKRLLREIHELAWAYGWSEEAILRMSAKRRGAYLEMLSV